MNLIGYTSAEETAYYRMNAHGDVVAVVDGFGETLKTYKYEVFGKQEEDGNEWLWRVLGVYEEDTNPFRYCAEYYDEETEFIYLRARYYSPKIQRFISEDTHWNPTNMIYGDDGNNGVPNINTIMQGSNFYIYCGNNPISRYDPSGNNWFTDRLKDIIHTVQAIGNYANDKQKAAQRAFWKTGSRLLLINIFGYETSAWLLEHSLQDNPETLYRGDDSRIAELVKSDNSFTSLLDSVMAEYATGSTFTSEEKEVIFNSGDLFYSIHSATITFNGVKQDDGSWLISCRLHDIYDYTEFLTMMKDSDEYGLEVSLGTIANDLAAISQMTGAIQPYDIYVDFTVRWQS